MNQCRYLIMAGGTGGHIFPALVVAKELSTRGAEVSWLGTRKGMESHIVSAEKIDLKTIDIKGFRGKNWASKIIIPFLLCRAVIQAIIIIRAENPAVVIGFGGFVTAPGGIAARLLGKKLIIHEQNAITGTTNRLLAKIAHVKLAAFPHSFNDAIHVGNPVRSMINNQNVMNSKLHNKIRILIMGGSLGAKVINDLVPYAFSSMNHADDLEICHQTGIQKKESVVKIYQTLKVNAEILEFIDDVGAAYAWADLLICRSGGLTVSEVMVAGVPAIFVPLPSAVDNHQFYNAKWLADKKAAILIEQKNFTKDVLSEQLTLLNENREELAKIREFLKALPLPNATDKIVKCCEGLCYGC